MPMEKANPKPRKGLKLCCGIAAITLVILLITGITLVFTVFKPKNPQITAHPTTLENVSFEVFPKISINATLGLVLTIKNPNYGSFRFKNSTAYVNYHDTVIAELPVESANVPSRGMINVSSYANLTGDKLVSSPFFTGDLSTGELNFTSETNMHGKVSVWKIIKLGAKVVCTCNISVSVLTRDVLAECGSSIKLL